MPPAAHVQIATILREAITRGELAPGAAVPSEADLTARFDVSRGTVRQALAALRSEGLISGGRGRRPRVQRPALAQSFDQLVSFSAWARQLERTPGARTLELVRRPCPVDLAVGLELEPGTPVVQYTRLRLLDDEPAMLERSTFVEAVGRHLFEFELDDGSVYAQLGAAGVELAEAEQEISAVRGTPELTERLGLPRRAAVLQVRRRVFDPAGLPIELSLDHYRGDAFTITVHNRVAIPGAGVALGHRAPGRLG